MAKLIKIENADNLETNDTLYINVKKIISVKSVEEYPVQGENYFYTSLIVENLDEIKTLEDINSILKRIRKAKK